MTKFGLTSTGFVPMRQSDIISALQAQLQAAFGVALNLSAQSVLGQIVGIFSEREALLWELLQAIYTSQYPSGAEGTSVDNILALSNIRRLAATATKTAPTNQSGTPGLVLYGTPGTIIPAGSIISTQQTPSVQFTLDAAVTIAAAVNGVQIIVLSAPPTQGAFKFTLEDPAGNTLTCPDETFDTPSLTTTGLPWCSPANVTQLSWRQPPSSGAFTLTLSSALGVLTTPSRNYTVSAAQVQADIRALNGAYGGVTVSGSISGAVLATTGTVTNGSFAITGLASTVGIVIGMAVTGTNIPANAYVVGIIGNTVTMSASATGTATETIIFSAALTINWGSASQPTVTFGTNSLAPIAGRILNSIQSAFNTLFDTHANNYPYTDVTCTGSLATSSVTVTFGNGTLISGQPTSGAQPQATIDVTADSLQIGSTVVNMAVSVTAGGDPVQGTGSATCSVTGPNVVPAGFLTVIGSPVAGWGSVTNPLDCVTGTNVETDTAALVRRIADLASNANGPLDSIIEKVSQVSGVVQAVGFQNLSGAALQVLTFSAVPNSGAFILHVNGGLGAQNTGSISYQALANVQALYFSAVPSAGSFTITMNSLTTSAIAYTATAAQVQAAVQALAGFSNAVVTGSFAQGFFLSFGAGTSQQYPISATNSLTGATITAVPSVQAMINAIPGYGFAQVIGSFAATMIVSFNGSSGGQPQALIAIPTNTLEIGATPITITPAFGRPPKSFEIVVNDNNGQALNSAIAEAIFGSAPAGIESYGNQAGVLVSDAFGNTYLIYFSRPQQVPIYVSIVLETDLTLSSNPQFNIGNIIQIQEDVAAAINETKIGGLVIGFGTDGLIGSFNNIPGVLSYTMTFGTSPNPTQSTNIQLLPEQVAVGETFNVIVSYS